MKYFKSEIKKFLGTGGDFDAYEFDKILQKSTVECHTNDTYHFGFQLFRNDFFQWSRPLLLIVF